jgi:hypothetical protein
MTEPKMIEPTPGQYLFAVRLLSTEVRSRRLQAPAWWNTFFNLAVATSFAFFFFM